MLKIKGFMTFSVLWKMSQLSNFKKHNKKSFFSTNFLVHLNVFYLKKGQKCYDDQDSLFFSSSPLSRLTNPRFYIRFSTYLYYTYMCHFIRIIQFGLQSAVAHNIGRGALNPSIGTSPQQIL